MNTNTNTVITSVSSPIIGDAIIANATKFGNITIAYIPLDFMFVNADYQRPPQRSINRIAANFDENKCGFLLVNYDKSTGKFAIVDGQHRFLAAQQAGIKNLPCQILNLESAKSEAMVFARQNENVTRVSGYDKFRAKVFAGDPNAKQISEICRKHGVTMVRNGYSVGKTRSITAIEKTFRKSADCLDWVLDVLMDKTTWGRYDKGLQARYINMLSSLYNDAKANLDFENTIINTMRSVSPDNLWVVAKHKYPYLGGRQAACVQFIRDMASGSAKEIPETV